MSTAFPRALLRRRNILVAIVLSGVCILICTRGLLHSPYMSALRSAPGSLIHGRGQAIHGGLSRNASSAKGSTVSTAALQVKLPGDHTYMSGSVPNDVKPSGEKKLIVMYNRPEWLFPADPHYLKVFDTCPYTCTMTDNKGQLPLADAVWVDIGRLYNSQPPPNRPPRQMWVAYNIESPVHFIGQVSAPAWRSAFNWTFSYRTDSDFFRPYGEFALRAQPAAKNYTQIMMNKRKPIAWFVSNCYTASRREQYVAELKRYIDVDVYGSCGTLQCPGLAEEKCFKPLNDTYFFYLAFENSYCQDYATEKLFKTYKNLNVIPIVRGALNYSRYLPPNTYLDAANFSSPRHLADYLHGLMKDPHTYTGMLRTKDHFYTSFTSWVFPNLKPFCRLCRQLQMSPVPPKVYRDIMDWSSKDKCW
ncbi:hypothetical protein ACOMHN_022763 [Nucella lapillus]